MSDFPALDDFNEFSAPSGGSQGDFLARERELLGDEFGPTPTGVPSSNDFSEKPKSSFPDLEDDFAPSTGAASAGRSNNDFMSSFERDTPKEPSRNSASVAIDDDDDDELGGNNAAVQQFQTQYPDLDVYPAQQQAAPSSQQQNGYSMEPSYSQPSYSTPAPAEPESDAIRAWREKQQAEIHKRDEASAERKEEIVRKAEKAIDDFYATYNQKKERQIAQNKENEAAFTQARDDALAKGTTWERIADMIELQDSRSKTVSKGTRDLSRMKEVLLSLKREGENAPNAAGY